MNVNNVTAASIYATQQYESKKNTSSKEDNQINRDKNIKDTYVSSEEGMEALENSKKDYDLSKVMEIHEKGFSQIPTREESEYYWNARKNDPELDARLYEQDKAKALQELGQVQAILMKAVSGQPLTPEEEEIVQNDPLLQAEISKRKAEAQTFKTEE